MAAVPVDLECSVSSGFAMDPNEHQRIGWVTKLDGFGLPVGGLQADLQVSDPLAAGNGKPMVVPVVGVLEKFSWAGGAADSLYVDFCVSQENATQLKALQQTALKNTAVKVMDFIVIDFDPEAKAWFTELIPGQPLSGTIVGKGNPQLNVDLTGIPAKEFHQDGREVLGLGLGSLSPARRQGSAAGPPPSWFASASSRTPGAWLAAMARTMSRTRRPSTGASRPERTACSAMAAASSSFPDAMSARARSSRARAARRGRAGTAPGASIAARTSRVIPSAAASPTHASVVAT